LWAARAGIPFGIARAARRRVGAAGEAVLAALLALEAAGRDLCRVERIPIDHAELALNPAAPAFLFTFADFVADELFGADRLTARRGPTMPFPALVAMPLTMTLTSTVAFTLTVALRFALTARLLARRGPSYAAGHQTREKHRERTRDFAPADTLSTKSFDGGEPVFLDHNRSCAYLKPTSFLPLIRRQTPRSTARLGRR
jgi:hypothetical protein